MSAEQADTVSRVTQNNDMSKEIDRPKCLILINQTVCDGPLLWFLRRDQQSKLSPVLQGRIRNQDGILPRSVVFKGNTRRHAQRSDWITEVYYGVSLLEDHVDKNRMPYLVSLYMRNTRRKNLGTFPIHKARKQTDMETKVNQPKELGQVQLTTDFPKIGGRAKVSVPWLPSAKPQGGTQASPHTPCYKPDGSVDGVPTTDTVPTSILSCSRSTTNLRPSISREKNKCKSKFMRYTVKTEFTFTEIPKGSRVYRMDLEEDNGMERPEDAKLWTPKSPMIIYSHSARDYVQGIIQGSRPVILSACTKTSHNLELDDISEELSFSHLKAAASICAVSGSGSLKGRSMEPYRRARNVEGLCQVLRVLCIGTLIAQIFRKVQKLDIQLLTSMDSGYLSHNGDGLLEKNEIPVKKSKKARPQGEHSHGEQSAHRDGHPQAKLAEQPQDNLAGQSQAKPAEERQTKCDDQPHTKLADQPKAKPAILVQAMLAEERQTKCDDQPQEKLADQPQSKLADQPEAKLADQAQPKRADQPKANPVNQRQVNSDDQSQANPADTSQANLADQSKANPADQPQANPADTSQANLADQSQANPADQPQANSADQPQANPADQPQANSAHRSQANPADQSQANPADQPQANPADQPQMKLADEPQVNLAHQEAKFFDQRQRFTNRQVEEVCGQRSDRHLQSRQVDQRPTQNTDQPQAMLAEQPQGNLFQKNTDGYQTSTKSGKEPLVRLTDRGKDDSIKKSQTKPSGIRRLFKIKRFFGSSRRLKRVEDHKVKGEGEKPSKTQDLGVQREKKTESDLPHSEKEFELITAEWARKDRKQKLRCARRLFCWCCGAKSDEE